VIGGAAGSQYGSPTRPPLATLSTWPAVSLLPALADLARGPVWVVHGHAARAVVHPAACLSPLNSIGDRNKGKIVGQKAPLKVRDIWALRVRLQMECRVRELALFNLGIDSKLGGCDLVALKVRDVCHGDLVATRAVVTQHKTQRPVQFEISH
jgi:hypothetical protein